jgi:hypothetical protein
MTHISWNSSSALRFLWGALLATAYLSAVVLVPLAFGFANNYNHAVQQGLPFQAHAYSGALPAPAVPDPNKEIAVVVTGTRGAEITDSLPPFEILARSGVFNVYSVAPQRTVLPLSPGPVMGASGLDFVPHFSFSEYDALIGTPPDVIVVPAVPN